MVTEKVRANALRQRLSIDWEDSYWQQVAADPSMLPEPARSAVFPDYNKDSTAIHNPHLLQPIRRQWGSRALEYMEREFPSKPSWISRLWNRLTQ